MLKINEGLSITETICSQQGVFLTFPGFTKKGVPISYPNLLSPSPILLSPIISYFIIIRII